MGRPRKPTADHVRDGTYRENEHGNRQREPKFTGQPVKPKGLSKDASAHWDFVVPLLASRGVATEADTPALIAMCNCWSNYMTAERSKPIKGLPGAGRARQMEINGYLREWRAFAAKFGLTPVDRSHIEVPEGSNPSNTFEAFMKSRMSSNN